MKKTYPLLAEVEPGKDEKGTQPSCSPAYAVHFCPDLQCSPPGDPMSLLDTFRTAAKTSPSAAALGWRPKVNGRAQPYAWKSYADAYKEASHIGAALHSLGASKGAAVGIYSTNCPEWVLAMKGIDYCGAKCVPLYDTFGADAVKFIIDHSGAKVIFCATINFDALCEALPDIKGQLTQVVVWAVGPDAPSAEDTASSDTAEKCGVPVVTWESMLKFGKSSPIDPMPSKLDDLCTIMYTSGTTGDPKGVELSHRAVLTSVGALAKLLKQLNLKVGTDDVFVSYLPLAHIFDRVAEELFLAVGARIGYWQGSPKTLMNDVAAAKPTIFVGVPRIFDRVYSKVTEKVSKSGVVAKGLFKAGCFLKNQALRFGVTQVPGVDHLIFHKIKAQLGGRVRIIVSGGAPLASHVEHFLKLTMCCPVTQGYGLTETCAASFIANPYDVTQASTVGAPVPGLLARLESIKDMEYDARRDPPQGELLIKGAAVFRGYHKRSDLTEEALDSEGWFHTGDIAEMLPKGAFKIVDRKKNLLKLSHGEYVAVEKLENQFKKCSLVDQIWVHGNSEKSALVSVVVPDTGALTSWAKDQGKSTDMKELCADEAAADYVQKELEKEGRSSGLKGFEIVKKVYLASEEFSVENDLITPSFKLKRPQLKKRFAKEIEQMYNALGL